MKDDKPGLKIITDPRVEAAHVDFVVCLRVADLPNPSSLKFPHKELCRDCGHEIWVASTSPTKPKKLCASCVLLRIERDGEAAQLLISQDTSVGMGSATAAAIAAILKAHDTPTRDDE